MSNSEYIIKVELIGFADELEVEVFVCVGGCYVAGETLRERLVQVYLCGPEHQEIGMPLTCKRQIVGDVKYSLLPEVKNSV